MPALRSISRVIRSLLFATARLAMLTSAQPAQASEGGASFYLLGAGGAGNAILPPVRGIFFNSTTYYYVGSAGGGSQFVIGGNVVADLKAKIAAEFATILWVPSTDVLGGTLAIGSAFAAGYPSIKVGVVLTGPRGGQLAINAKDAKFIVADPVLTAALSWDVGGNTHIAASTMVNVPIGHYREGELSNLSFHRWAADASLGVSWHDTKAGWDVSGKAGVTFNGTNHSTNYNTGTEFHIEASVERLFSPEFSAGLQAFRFQQLSGDSGSGAVLGSNKGEVTGVGATAAYNFTMGKTPVTARLQLFKEINAVNRLEGEVAMFSLSLPLKMILPPAAGQAK